MHSLLTLLLLSAPPPMEIALTLDDLPNLGALAPGETTASTAARLLAQIIQRKLPAVGFVNCGRGDISVLDPWVVAGVPLGNHSWSHGALDTHPDWMADVERCGEAMAARWGRASDRPFYFRYPFLQQGATAEKREATKAALLKAGYQIAPVTIDTSDWVLARAYEAAIKAGDKARQAAIGAALVDHVAEATARFAAITQRRVGRPVKHILLMHGSALTADHLGAVLDRLAPTTRFISLAEALTDPVYQVTDGYAGPIGMSFLLRMAPAEPATWGYDVGQARALGERFGVAGEGLPEGKAGRVAPGLRLLRLTPRALVVVHEAPWAANSLLYEAKDGTLILAGSPYTPETTRDLLDWLRTRYGQRPIVYIATHFHFDASGGMAAIQAAGGRTLASARTVELLATRQKGLRDGMLELLKDRPDQVAAFRNLVVPPPAETFPDGQGLHLDFGEPVEIIDPGAGHSEDNIVVWFPESKLLFGGCLVRAQLGTGYTGDADLGHWSAAIEVLKPLGATFIVPGHGDRFGPELLDFTQKVVAGAGADPALEKRPLLQP